MVHMKILKDRKEWLNNRQLIGGSDAASILGMNPYKSNYELWNEKANNVQSEDISDKPYVRYGIEAEQHLRELFKLDFPQYQLEYAENNIWHNDRYPFAHASLDGWLTDEKGRKGIWECKTTNILQSMQKEKWDKRIHKTAEGCNAYSCVSENLQQFEDRIRFESKLEGLEKGRKDGVAWCRELIKAFTTDWNSQSNKRIPYKAMDELDEFIMQSMQRGDIVND